MLEWYVPKNSADETIAVQSGPVARLRLVQRRQERTLGIPDLPKTLPMPFSRLDLPGGCLPELALSVPLLASFYGVLGVFASEPADALIGSGVPHSR